MKKISNNITELVFIIDRSGSMYGLESDTIGGFNSLIEKQKAQDGKAYVTTVLFNTDEKTVHDRAELKKVKPMTAEDYCVGGCTALFDAVGDTIKHIASIHKYGRKEDVPAHTMFVIITDGMENASKRYSRNTVKEMIEHEKEKYGWEFVFIGANIDAAETGESFGIGRERSVNYIADSRGTEVLYDTVSQNVSALRTGQQITECWGQRIDEDYRKRFNK